jgi:hypothetical protein
MMLPDTWRTWQRAGLDTRKVLDASPRLVGKGGHTLPQCSSGGGGVDSIPAKLRHTKRVFFPPFAI